MFVLFAFTTSAITTMSMMRTPASRPRMMYELRVKVERLTGFADEPPSSESAPAMRASASEIALPEGDAAALAPDVEKGSSTLVRLAGAALPVKSGSAVAAAVAVALRLD